MVTESGVWGAIPRAFDEFGPGAGLRDLAYAAASLLLVPALAGWLAALSIGQATSDAVALPALERAIVAITEIDGLLDLHAADLEEQASSAGRITLPGYPLDVTVPAAGVTTSTGDVDQAQLRAALLERSALLLHVQGTAAFQDPDGVPASPSRFSSAGLMDTLIDMLRDGRQERWTSLLGPFALVSLGLIAATLLLGVGFGRLTRVGVAMALAGALVLGPGLFLRLTIGFAGDDDAIGDEARSIARSLLRTPTRNALLIAAGGVAIAIPALVLDHLFEGSARRAAANAAPRDE